ncbi:hypothetical protein BXY66_1199 [Shimia isoporae]|uniref:Uncharacterized protein n=1 Tax=Shimia isoporae TaxID=647720 RepID=A0A4R1NLL1_9RHOB|nr:hypothetical protein BXY66_1199 [Shimia isoporae]
MPRFLLLVASGTLCVGFAIATASQFCDGGFLAGAGSGFLAVVSGWAFGRIFQSKD